MPPFNTTPVAPNGYSLPPHWTPLLARALRQEEGRTFYEVGTLPAAQAFGAPPRIDVNIEHDTVRGLLVVRAVRLERRLVPLHECGADWIGLWLESLPRALEAEVRRRRSTVPMRVPARPTR